MEVLVEILLSLLAQPSHLMRQVARSVFGHVCSHLTLRALQLILDVSGGLWGCGSQDGALQAQGCCDLHGWGMGASFRVSCCAPLTWGQVSQGHWREWLSLPGSIFLPEMGTFGQDWMGGGRKAVETVPGPEGVVREQGPQTRRPPGTPRRC